MTMKKKKLEKWLKLVRAIGLRDALASAVLKALKREVLMPVSVLGEKIHIRTATPDLNVAVSSLVDGEYAAIQCENARVIIDAGANIGTSSIFFARKFPQATIYAIEPEQGNFDLLVKNTGAFKNIVPIRAAIWGSNETREVQSRMTGHWGYTVAETTNRTQSTGQEIQCITMASLIEQYEIAEISILKMDIEGGEKAVLETSAAWLDKVRIITIELHDRICAGCSDAFKAATTSFKSFEQNGEKITAYRD